MAFHRFQQLPAELRLQIWECAIDESRLVADGQKRVCRIVAAQASLASPEHPSKLAIMMDFTIGYVCHESREVFRHVNKFRDYIPAADVVYIDDYNSWIALGIGSLRQIRHIALSAKFCYDMLKIEHASPTAFAKLGCVSLQPRSSPTSYHWDFFHHATVCCPDLESITVVLPPLEKDMPNYADHVPQTMRPTVLRIVSYSEISKIRITGPYTYTTCLRGSPHVKRRYLGPFIKDVNAVWENNIDLHLGENDQRRAITIQAGVLQYLV